MHVWKIHTRAPGMHLPRVILTAKGSAITQALPPEIAALLPTQQQDGNWLTELDDYAGDQPVCAGFFMANPLQQWQRTLSQLRAASVGWVINLPSVSQHDAEFAAHLSEVGLGPRRELQVLKSYQEEGFSCIATVATAKDAEHAVSLGLKTLAVLPRVQAYEGGFPSELSRNRAVGEVSARLTGTDVTVLSLVSAAEAGAQSVWPPVVNAVIERPER